MLHKMVSSAIVYLGEKNLVSKKAELKTSTDKHIYLQSFQCFKCKGLYLLESFWLLPYF